MSNTPIIGATYDERANNCAKYLHTQLTLLGKPEDYLTEEAWEHELKTIHVAYPIITAIDKVDTNLYNNTPTPSTRHHANKGFFARFFGI